MAYTRGSKLGDQTRLKTMELPPQLKLATTRALIASCQSC